MNRQAILRTAYSLLGALLLALRAGGAPAAEPWPEMPPPPKAKTEWIGDSMRVNGIPMRVMHFASSASRTEIVEYYRSYWSSGYPTPPSVRPLGDATVVGQAHGPYFMTVKVKDAEHGTSEGLISVSRVLGSKVERSAGELPLMPGAKVLQVVESSDPGKRSREVVVRNPDAVPSVVQYYQASLTNAGWRLVQHNDTPRGRPGLSGSILVFHRDRGELQLSVVVGPTGRDSVLVANLVTKDTRPQRF